MLVRSRETRKKAYETVAVPESHQKTLTNKFSSLTEKLLFEGMECAKLLKDLDTMTVLV